MSGQCVKHGPHAPGVCPQCEELAEAREIVATTPVPDVAEHVKSALARALRELAWCEDQGGGAGVVIDAEMAAALRQQREELLKALRSIAMQIGGQRKNVKAEMMAEIARDALKLVGDST